MEYRLTDKGTSADLPKHQAGQILEWMKAGHGVVNPAEIEFSLDIPEAKVIMDKLVQAGYLGKQEEFQKQGMFQYY